MRYVTRPRASWLLQPKTPPDHFTAEEITQTIRKVVGGS